MAENVGYETGGEKDIEEIRVMTYNLWFDDQNREMRMDCIIQMMENSNADFFCLQEVTAYSMTRILQAPFIRQSYFVSGNHILGYGVLVVSRFPAVFYESPFPTL